MAVREFKAESKKLMEMMIHSIYSQKEIFLRELISNASDAIDKIYYRALTDDAINFDRDHYSIEIKTDKENRMLKISDTGIGMTEEDLEENLGTIAQSGSLNFKSENESKDDHDIIGQFGVGFYSAFMVADKVTVISKALDSDQAFKWESQGIDGYTITTADKDSVGTDII
ncbi:chaperone protein HtpG [Sporolactobacillus inulinus]|nr:chaperone protein HtpG [Sporolactobacillus inulinus]